jgi:hypothetical protein
MGRRANLVAAAGLVLVAGSLSGWRVWANRVPKTTASRSDLQRFVASDKFKQLPTSQQSEYADAMLAKGLVLRGDGLPDEQALAAMRNAAAAHHKEMLDEYLKLKGKARLDFLDKQIDVQERIRKMMEDRPTTQPGKGDNGPHVVIRKGGPGAAGQKQMMESVPADQQAAMAQFMKDLADRRKERGLPAMGGPGGGGGGIVIIRTMGPGK